MAKNKEQGVNNKGRSGTGVWGRRFFILVVFAGVFLSCALPSGEDWTEETNRQQSIGAGAVLDLTPFIPAPAAGATPVRSFAAGSFVGIVDWTEGGVVNGSTVTGVFRAETAYRAGVTLYPMEGYTFTGGAGFSYAGETLHPIYGTIGEAAVEIGFGETGNDIWAPSTPSEPAAVNGVNLALYFPPPADNAAPVRSFAGSGFVGIVAWKDTGNGDVPAFEAHEDYTAAVTLHPVKGYTLEGAGAFYYGNPADTLTSTPIEPEGLALEAIAFTGTEAGPWVVKPADITNVALTKSHIPAPKAGGTPAGSFAGAQFVGTVVWKDGNETPLSGLFAVNTAYTAAVTVYPLTGYAFAEGVSVTYEGSDDKLTNIESTAETITLDIGPFPQTSMNDQDGTTTPVKVSESDLDLAPYIPAPTAGGTPVRSFGAATFVGIVAWTDGEEAVPGLFEPGKSHTAAVTLYATAGYTFKDVPGYIHSKGGTVGSVNTSPEAGDVTLTVSFTTPTEGAPWAAAEPEPVTLLDLTGLIPAPAAGAVPAATVVSDEYIGIVSWRVTGGGAHSGLFQAYTAYTAEATLYPLGGYTFAEIPATPEEGGGCFSHNMSKTVAHGEGTADGPLTVTITFLVSYTAPIVVGW